VKPRSRVPAQGVARPEDVRPDVWRDFQALRDAKKALVTPTVLVQARREAEKAGLRLENFLEIWCLRGTQGLQASWLREDEKAQYSSRRKSPLHSDDIFTGAI
jgi:hypothetical protein